MGEPGRPVAFAYPCLQGTSSSRAIVIPLAWLTVRTGGSRSGFGVDHAALFPAKSQENALARASFPAASVYANRSVRLAAQSGIGYELGTELLHGRVTSPM